MKMKNKDSCKSSVDLNKIFIVNKSDIDDKTKWHEHRKQRNPIKKTVLNNKIKDQRNNDNSRTQSIMFYNAECNKSF